jgi:putative thioredoxin
MPGQPNIMGTLFSFDKQVLERSDTIPVIVEFSAPGCGPCKWMEATLTELTKRNSGKFEFVSIPISFDSEMIKKYQISSNPTTILFKNRRPMARLSGALPLMVLQQWVDDHI